MMKKKMNPATERKLRLLADAIIKKWGEDAKYLDYPLREYDFVATRNGLSMSKHTIRHHQDWLDKHIRRILDNRAIDAFVKEVEFSENDLCPFPEPVIEQQTLINPPEIVKFIIGGYEWEYKLVLPELVKEVKPEVNIEQPVLWMGLFDYKNENEIIIRRGPTSPFLGCNVKNKKSITEYFGTFKRFEKWCKDRIADVELGKIKPNVDTPKDMETLQKILKTLSQLRSENII